MEAGRAGSWKPMLVDLMYRGLCAGGGYGMGCWTVGQSRGHG